MSNNELTLYHTYQIGKPNTYTGSMWGEATINTDEPVWWINLISSKDHDITALKKYLKDEYGCRLCEFSKAIKISTQDGRYVDSIQKRTYLNFRSVSEKFRFVLEHVSD
jgi:hypothetical protein